MELFKLFGTIALDNSEANKGIDETTDKAEKAQPKISSAFSKVGDAAVKVGKVVASGLAVGAAAIGALTKQSLDSYADYEQLVGGVETLFKESASTIMDYADRAYETAGLSANEYMETVTSFSASLIQGLGGDTAKAAEYAETAITDMADNANKMGTSMSMIQNAYQGFAKQNYTMLDNLKLGYGGTQTEMFRLMQDAKKLDSTFDAVFSIDSKGHLEAEFADIVQAIHIVQENMGITGTTANEAASTISGSVASMKAQWQNLLTAFAGDDWDIGVYVSNFVDAAMTAAHNIVPRLAQILSGLSDAMAQIMPIVVAELPVILQELLPGLISGATALVTGLVQNLPVILAILLAELPNTIQQLSTALVETFPILLQTVKDLFSQIWNYIAVELLGTEADFETSFGKIKKFFNDLWAELQEIWRIFGQPVWEAIQECIAIVRDAFAERMPEIKEFVSGCFEDISAFWNDNLKPCLEAIGSFIKENLAPVFDDVFNNKIMPVVDACFGAIKDLWNNTLKPVLTGITDFLTGVFTGNWKKAFEGLVSIVKGVANGIINGIEFMVNGAIRGLNGLIEGLNKVIGLAGSLLGLNVSIPTIRELKLPRLEEGGILEKGQIGLLEGKGAEAVVPLDQNQAWISAVAKDMQNAIGGNGTAYLLEQILDALKTMDEGMTEKLTDAFDSMRFDINSREFARMVKAVN